MNTRSLTLFVGTLSLLLGLWAVLSDTAAMGMAAGAVGFVAGLMVLLPSETHRSNGSAGTGGTASTEPPESRSATTTASAGDTSDDGPTGEGVPTPSSGVDQSFLEADSGDAGPGTDPLLSEAALMDPETNLFSEGYLKVALESRLASARRHLRPVALALVEVSEGLPDQNGGEASPRTVADAVSRTLRDSDIACRMENGTFAVILEDTPENGAVWTVERIRRNLVSTAGHHTLWAGVACYPAHAFDGPELLTAVGQALEAAKAWNQDRIEVAIAD
ncbi:MAG: GGDEF domain-containing protein [Microthrixaceae bacterium]